MTTIVFLVVAVALVTAALIGGYCTISRYRMQQRLEAVIDRMAERLVEETEGRRKAERETQRIIMLVEPLLQKTAWSMGEIYQARGQEVARNAQVDSIRRALADFNLPDPIAGGSYEDLSSLKPYTKGGNVPNRPYAEGTS